MRGTARFGKVTFTEAMAASMLRHAFAVLPEEAVGLLGGDADGCVRRVLPLKNVAPRGAFLADPHSQYQALRELEAAGWVPVGVYHSHPAGGTDLSSLDRRLARGLGLVQVVVALARPWRPGVELRAYRVEESGVEEVEVVVEGPVDLD